MHGIEYSCILSGHFPGLTLTRVHIRRRAPGSCVFTRVSVASKESKHAASDGCQRTSRHIFVGSASKPLHPLLAVTQGRRQLLHSQTSLHRPPARDRGSRRAEMGWLETGIRWTTRFRQLQLRGNGGRRGSKSRRWNRSVDQQIQ